MIDLMPTEMESTLLHAFHECYREAGFPPPERIAVVRRDNTGAGRYTYLRSDARLQLVDGYYDLPGRLIRMTGVPYGLSAVVVVEGQNLDQLEISVNGDDEWDGEERSWALV